MPTGKNHAVSTEQTEIQGLEAVRSAFADLGWFLKEAAGPDWGIDLFVETATEDGHPSGRLLGVQVKSGPSYVLANGDGVIYPEQRHVDYWRGYSLPVIVTVYDPTARASYWQLAAEENFEATPTARRIVVPKVQKLDLGAQNRLLTIAAEGPEPDKAAGALNRLRSDLSWMEILDAGGSVTLVAEEWINKTSGRGRLALAAEPAGGGERVERQSIVFLGLRDYADALPGLFPWADLHVDEDAADDAEYDVWMEETGIWDSAEGAYIGNYESFSDWRGDRYPAEELRPVGESAGEVAHWRLVLTLNALGRGVVALEKYVNG